MARKLQFYVTDFSEPKTEKSMRMAWSRQFDFTVSPLSQITQGSSRRQKSCLYWSPDKDQACLMTKGGLFIPLPEHIELFCNCSNYPQCHQYIQGSKQIQEMTPRFQMAGSDSRRRYRRVCEKALLSIANCSPDGLATEILDEAAYTVDISLGGMRFVSSQRFSAPQSIIFSLGQSFLSPSQTGRAIVRWNRRTSHTDLYETGAAFFDEKTIQIVSNHLGIHEIPQHSP